MKTYSILGCGWLGLPLAKHFISEGIAIKGTTRTEEKSTFLYNEGIQPYIINIDEAPDFKDFLDVEVLLIMITSKKLEAYQNLIQSIVQSRVKKVVFISSTSVYPRFNKEYTEEDETIDSLLTKVESLFRGQTSFKTTIIRFAGLYGDKRQPGNWFKDKKIPQPYGFVNMVHRDDCIAIISQIVNEDIFGEIFNACVNHHPTRKDYYIAAKKRLGMPAPVFEETTSLVYKKVNPAKLIARLNYTFIHDDLLK